MSVFDTKSFMELAHAHRAAGLRRFFNPESLAEFLHQNYRAAAKSIGVPGPRHHDHGWCDCYGTGRRYFQRRALWLLSDNPSFNGRVK